MAVWRLPEAPFTCIQPIPLSCALRNSAFGLQVRVIRRQCLYLSNLQSQLEYSASVAALTSKERQFFSEENKLFFVLVISKAIVGSHRDNETVLHRKTFETQKSHLHSPSCGVK